MPCACNGLGLAPLATNLRPAGQIAAPPPLGVWPPDPMGPDPDALARALGTTDAAAHLWPTELGIPAYWDAPWQPAFAPFGAGPNRDGPVGPRPSGQAAAPASSTTGLPAAALAFGALLALIWLTRPEPRPSVRPSAGRR